MLRTDRLIELRKRKKLIQQNMADLLQITRSAYVRYEKGQNQPPNDALVKLADYFDVSTDYLLGKTNDPMPPDAKKEAPSEEEARQMLEDSLHKVGQLDPDEHITIEQYRSFIKSYKYWEHIRKDTM